MIHLLQAQSSRFAQARATPKTNATCNQTILALTILFILRQPAIDQVSQVRQHTFALASRGPPLHQQRVSLAAPNPGSLPPAVTAPDRAKIGPVVQSPQRSTAMPALAGWGIVSPTTISLTSDDRRRSMCHLTSPLTFAIASIKSSRAMVSSPNGVPSRVLRQCLRASVIEKYRQPACIHRIPSLI